MWGWLKPILDSVLSNVIAAVVSWVKAEEAESAKWAAESRKSMLESMREGLAKERALKEAVEASKVNAPTSASSWNARLVLLLAPFLLSGCFRFYVYTQPYRPVPPEIPRPTLAEDTDGDGVEDPLTDREKVLVDYATQLETVVEGVRSDAIDSNTRNGYSAPDHR